MSTNSRDSRAYLGKADDLIVNLIASGDEALFRAAGSDTDPSSVVQNRIALAGMRARETVAAALARGENMGGAAVVRNAIAQALKADRK